MRILTSDEDDFIYDYLINLLGEVKLVQGGSAIPPTLRRHKPIRDYLIEKQKVRLNHVEEKYFDAGVLNELAIENYHSLQERKRALQDSRNTVN